MQHQETPLQRALTEKQAAAYIGMSRSYLAQSRMDGRVVGRTPAPPFIKIGRSVRYLIEDLNAWLDEMPRCEHLGQMTNHGLPSSGGVYPRRLRT